jgi:hypothetical protein
MPSPRWMTLCMVGVLASACTSSSLESTRDGLAFYDNVLTLEMRLDDSNTDGEFELVNPDGIAVDAAGNIYVADEYTMKVFDPTGQPIALVGRKGKGPGEFDAPMRPTIGPRGHLTVQDVLWECNIYSADHEFIRRTRYRSDRPTKEYIQEKGFTFTMLNRVVSLGPRLRVIDLFALDQTLEQGFNGFSQLLLASPDTLIELVHYDSHGTVQTDPQSSTSVDFQGELLWCMLDRDQLLYIETRVDVELAEDGDGGEPAYILTTLNLSDLSTEQVAIPYAPLRIPVECKGLEPTHSEFLDRWFEPEPAVKEVLSGTTYYPPLKALMSDGGRLFGFRYSEIDTSDAEDEEVVATRPRPVDIIDVESGRLVAEAMFPFIPQVIRDGFAYRLYLPGDDFPSIMRFRIDPRIYGTVVSSGGIP